MNYSAISELTPLFALAQRGSFNPFSLSLLFPVDNLEIKAAASSFADYALAKSTVSLLLHLYL